MPKKIFTSYSWDNEEHKNWVAKLTNDLRSKYGFEATCDTIRGDGELDTMIVDGITKSDKIIVVVTPDYTYKAENYIGGVGKETKLLHTRFFKDDKSIIAITELTSLLSRRGIYCSKYPNSDFSVTKFDTAQGNIRFKRIDHTWVNGRCKYCGTNKTYDRGEELETHAYEFIHTDNLEKLFNMKFDVIIGNPPYQMSDGGGTGDSAKPIYQLFINQAKKIKPRFLSMIVPSRWMKGGKGLQTFRETMIEDTRIKYIYDFEDAQECFSGIHIDGGVNYFLWDSEYNGKVNYIYKPRELLFF